MQRLLKFRFSVNPFEILGLQSNATQAEIKQQYYKKAQMYHPDINKARNAKQKFSEVQQAYDMLKSGKSSYSDYQENTDSSSRTYQDSQYFYQDQYTNKKGEDIMINITLKVEDFINPIQKTINYQQKIKCTSCKDSEVEVKCKNCNGQGMVQNKKGNFIHTQQCIKCKGVGFVQKNCKTCKNKRFLDVKKDKKINIPSYVENNSVLRFQGEGNVSDANIYGDLLINMKLDSKDFIKQKDLVKSQEFISIDLAILGGELMVKTLRGDQIIQVQKGTQDKEEFLLKNQGVINDNGDIGDQLITLKVSLPKKITQEQIELYQQLKELAN